MRLTLFTIISLLIGLVSVAHSLNLRQSNIQFTDTDFSLFGGLPVRKVEVRSPISGILSKANISSTGYHSPGTAFVITAIEGQYYKGAITSKGKNLSVKRMVEPGRNVYIQIFREFFVTFFTSKSPGESVQQFDLLAILYVRKTQPGELPSVRKLPRSVATVPIALSFPADTSESSITDEVKTYVESSPQLQQTKQEDLSDDTPTPEETNERLSTDDSQESELFDGNNDLDQIPGKESVLTSDVSDSDENGLSTKSFSEVSEFVSDSEESRFSGTSSSSDNTDVQSGHSSVPISLISDTTKENIGSESDKKDSVVIESDLVSVSEASSVAPMTRDQSTQTDYEDPSVTAVEEVKSITSLSTSIPVDEESPELDTDESSEAESPESDTDESSEAESPGVESPYVESPIPEQQNEAVEIVSDNEPIKTVSDSTIEAQLEVETQAATPLGEALIDTEQQDAPVGEALIETEQQDAPVGEALIETEQQDAPVGEALIETEQQDAPVGEVQIETEQQTAPVVEVQIETEQQTSPAVEIDTETEEAPAIPEKPLPEATVEDSNVEKTEASLDTDSSSGSVDSNSDNGNEEASLNSLGRAIGSDIDNSGSDTQVQ